MESYCLLSKKPDKDKSNLELELEIVKLFEDSIKKVRASYVTDGLGERKEP